MSKPQPACGEGLQHREVGVGLHRVADQVRSRRRARAGSRPARDASPRASRRRAACRSGAPARPSAQSSRYRAVAARGEEGRAGQAGSSRRGAEARMPRRGAARAALSAGPSGRRPATHGAMPRSGDSQCDARCARARYTRLRCACDDSIGMTSTPDPRPTPSTTALTGAVLAGIEADGRPLLQDDVIDIDAQPHRRPAGAELSRAAARSSSTRSRRCTSCGWPPARAATTSSYVGGRWRDTRDGSEFFEALSQLPARRPASAGFERRFTGQRGRSERWPDARWAGAALSRSEQVEDALASRPRSAACGDVLVQADAADAVAAAEFFEEPLAADV